MKKESPSIDKLCNRVVQAIGEKGERSIDDISTKLVKSYVNVSNDMLNQYVRMSIQILENTGKITIGDEGKISLTNVGRNEYSSYVAKKKLKAKRRKKRLEEKVEKKKRIQERQLPPTKIHAELQANICDLGTLVGFETQKEFRLGKKVIIDAVWGKGKEISHAFEVQNRGDWKNALGNLEAAKRHHQDCKLYCIVNDKKQGETIKELLGERKEKSIVILRPAQIEKWEMNWRNIKQPSRKQLIEFINVF